MWLDPQRIEKWFIYSVPAHWDPEPAVDPRTGGRFSWSVVRDADHAAFRFHGTYREIRKPEKLVFTWEWDSLPIAGVDGAGNTVVTVEFVNHGPETTIVLTHTGFPSDAARDAHRKGWERCLDGMASLLVPNPHQGATPASEFVRVHSPVLALEHLQVIDGTGAQPKSDQTLLITGDKITALGDAASVQIPENAQRLDFSGYTAIPGLVGMHDHLFYVTTTVNNAYVTHDMPLSFPRLFLAAGVTTIRTTGSYEPYTDLEIKKAVDAGKLLGPHINVTGPYLVTSELGQIQIHGLTGPEDARRTVDYWASEGATSFKAYKFISRAELQAVVEAAHSRGLTVAGDLCSIGFREAAEIGMDSVEHGLFADSEFVPGKQPDVCPKDDLSAKLALSVEGEAIQSTIRALVQHHVAVTSTLAIYESILLPSWTGAPPGAVESLSEESLKNYLENRRQQTLRASDPSHLEANQRDAAMFRKEMEFERAFVRSGGLLLAGSDAVLPGVIAGFGDHRQLELLVQAGFTPAEAVKIATLNGAQFLKQAGRIGSLAVGKQADLVLLKGDLAADIHNIENVELVFKDGVGYDSKKLIASVKGQVGIR
jgi:imidazolonepropionase-like amidohydrolase/uncharacterized protein YndB with AHSA1/START domain